MTLQDLIQQGWAEHDKKTAELADRLEAHVALVNDANDAAQYMHLVNHAVGDHLGDRARALSLCEAAVERLGADAEGQPFLFLAVARRLAGDEDGASAAAQRLGDDPANEVRVDLLVAQGHMHAGDWDACAATYAAALGAAEALPSGHAGERAAAMVSSNVASGLLELEARDAAQDALMERAAQAGRAFWTRDGVGNWMNDERADYLLSLVHTTLGRPEQGREHAERGLATIEANGEEKVDEAFLHLARARACRDAGDTETQAASIEQAETLAEGFENQGLTDWFQGELAKSR